MSPILAPAAGPDGARPQAPRTRLDRLAHWWRTSTHTLWALPGVLGVFEMMVMNTVEASLTPLTYTLWTGVVLLAATCLLGRRRWPLAVVTVISLASAAADLWGPFGALTLLALVSLYALLATASTRDRLIGTPLSALCLIVPTVLSEWPRNGTMIPLIFSLALMVAAAIIIRLRREALEHADAQLAAQAAAQATEQHLTAQRDTARHQNQVAAELHDSVGHSLTAIIALSEGLRDTVTTDPTTNEAIDTINNLARDGLADTRKAVTSLHAPLPTAGNPDDATEIISSQTPSGTAARVSAGHGWAQLEDLLTTVRATGISAALTGTGRRPADMAADQTLGQAVYVVVREALTNAMRHAQGATRVIVSLDHGEAATQITVSDDGHGAAGDGGSDGHGLTNLAETVRELGGALTAGPVTDPGATGWVLRATIPFPKGAASR